ncbi:MAG: excinuclease ABC subunit UvrA [Planctomycetes bacterium]|nr:excinuclease ABC subunit UvrA [Planctomycetota bacterium]
MPNNRDIIRVTNARVHNLRNVSLELPRGRLICFTGVSGSGKSSLAFDTLYAEGQRRYIESLSSYARQFMGELPKPDVDQITGLSPSISIQQKTSGWNPRSTVGTITQIHDYLRVLMARAGDAHCPRCGKEVTAQSREHMLARILALPPNTAFLLLAPKVRAQKGEHRDLMAELVQQGFVRARVDGKAIELADPPPLDRYRRHDIEVVIDRLVVRDGVRPRLAEALDLALRTGGGVAIVSLAGKPATGGDVEPANSPRKRRRVAVQTSAAENDILLSSGYACIACGVSFEPPDPQLFSFNSPQGMCLTCDGLGEKVDFDPELLVPDPSKSMLDPCIAPLRTVPGKWPRHIWEGVARHVGFELETPWRDLPAKARHALLFGTGDAHLTFEWRGRQGLWQHGGTFDGILADLRAKYRKAQSEMVRGYYEQFMRQTPCPQCRGARLNERALAITLSGPDGDGVQRKLNIDAICRLPISAARAFFQGLRVDGVKATIAAEPLKEINSRLTFLVDVGLEYLSLDRQAPTLSGGESQRIRLASQIGCGLVGVLYVLDEPSIGLHPRDNEKLLRSLQRLRDMGNTVIVVEHDRDTMEAADVLVDFGPGAGVRGGEMVACGALADVADTERSITGAYLSGRREIEIPASRRPIVAGPAPRKRRSRAK